jgi:hypothetical protein
VFTASSGCHRDRGLLAPFEALEKFKQSLFHAARTDQRAVERALTLAIAPVPAR